MPPSIQKAYHACNLRPGYFSNLRLYFKIRTRKVQAHPTELGPAGVVGDPTEMCPAAPLPCCRAPSADSITRTGQTTSTADFGHQAQWFLLCLLDCKGLARVQTKTSPLALNEEMCCRIKPRQQALIQPNTNQYTTLASLQCILGGILQLALIVNTGGQNDFSGSLLGEIQNNL